MSSSQASQALAGAAGTLTLGDELTVNRMGFGAMRLTGKGIWGPPADRAEAVSVVRRAVELGVNFIDTADSYGPSVSEGDHRRGALPLPRGPRHRHQTARRGATAYQIALAWLLARSPAMLVIPGTSSVGHLEENVKAAEIRLGTEDLEEVASQSR